MGFSYLLRNNEDVESFKARFNIPCDVNISYCHKADIEDQRLPHVVFFPLMSILEGGVRFLVEPLLLRTLGFYGPSPDQCLPNFYKVVSCVGRLNQLYDLNVTHHDINFLYAIRGSLKNGYYLQTQNTKVRLISCLLNSNRNSVGEFVKVSRNWLNGELTCLTSPCQIGQYPIIYNIYFSVFLIYFIALYCRFQKIPSRPERCTSLRVKLCFVFRNFHALQQATKSFPFESRVHFLIHKLPRFVESSDSRKLLIVLS